jgi:Family of unknown function (DUF6334)
MEDVKIKAAQVLDAWLSNFCKIEDQALHAVWLYYEEGLLDRIVLDFVTVSLSMTAESDDDTISFAVSDMKDTPKTDFVNVSGIEPWCKFSGKPFGWGWITINQQDYTDGILLSFDGISPNLLFNVAASSIKVGVISPIS